MVTNPPRYDEPRSSLPAHAGPSIERASSTRATLRRAALAIALIALPGLALADVPVKTTLTAKGRITGGAALQNPVWNEAKERAAHRYTFREPSPTVLADARALSGYLPKELCIVALGDKGAPNPRPLRVVVAGGRTTPVTLVVAEGQQIQFENRDPFPHRIYDTGKKGLLAGDMQPTKTRAWTPPGPGKYEIRDETTPSLRSWIVVEPKTVGVSYPNAKGDFGIELDPGNYKLRGYFNGEPVGDELPIVILPGQPEQTLRDPLVVGKPKTAGSGG